MGGYMRFNFLIGLRHSQSIRWQHSKMFAAVVLPVLIGVGVMLFSTQSSQAKKKRQSVSTIHYNIKSLPPFVRKMHGAIYRAARSGDLEMMRTILETNELLPLINDKLIRKPVDFWIKESVAGDGLSVFADMSKILEAGYTVRKGKDNAALYIWPYFANVNLKSLQSHQKVQLYRMVSAKAALAMMQSGKFNFYSLGIGEDGTWHFFTKNTAS